MAVELLSIEQIVALLREQAAGRAPENDERSLLLDAADFIATADRGDHNDHHHD